MWKETLLLFLRESQWLSKTRTNYTHINTPKRFSYIIYSNNIDTRPVHIEKLLAEL